MEILSSLGIVAVVGMSVGIPIVSLVRSCVFVLFCFVLFCFVLFCFVVIDMFGNSFVALMSYETANLRVKDNFRGRVLLRSYGVVSLISIAHS